MELSVSAIAMSSTCASPCVPDCHFSPPPGLTSVFATCRKRSYVSPSKRRRDDLRATVHSSYQARVVEQNGEFGEYLFCQVPALANELNRVQMDIDQGCAGGMDVNHPFSFAPESMIDIDQSRSKVPGNQTSSVSLGYSRLRTLLELLAIVGFCMDFSAAPEFRGRQRGLLPLPELDSLAGFADCPNDIMEQRILLDYVNCSIACLNGLHSGVLWKAHRVGKSYTKAQHSALQHMVSGIVRFASRLSSHEPVSNDASRPPASYPDLHADNVDNLDQSGLVDACSFVPPELSEPLADPESFFDPSRGLPRTRVNFSAGSREEYAKLVSKQLKSGKRRLRFDVEGAGSVFVVGKATGRQREVWHGGVVSSWAPAPPKPKHLPTPSDLIVLEASKERPVRLSKRDCKCWFDQMRCPDGMRPWFGQPPLAVHELMRWGGFTIHEVSEFLDYQDGATGLSADDLLFPVSTVFPMGFSWSPAMAQSTLLEIADRAGFQEDLFLAADQPFPQNLSPDGQALALATDDLMHFCRDRRIAEDAMQAYEQALEIAGVLKNESKDITGQKDGTAIGVDLCEGCRLDANAQRLCTIWDQICFLVKSKRASPRHMQAIMGVIQWMDLLNRCKLSVYQEVYGFNRLRDLDVERTVPIPVLRELCCSCLLGWAWSADLCREYSDKILATDASETFGFGVSCCASTQTFVRSLATLSERRGDYIRLHRDLDDDPPLPRIGVPNVLALSKSDFVDVLCVKAKRKDHASVLELNALVLAVEWLLRSAGNQGRRYVFLVDSKATLGAAAKGRSSSGPYLRLLRRLASLILFGNLLIHLVYVPSEDNPSDSASRGKRRRPKHRAYGKVRKLSKQDWKLERHFRNLDRAYARLKQTGMITSQSTSSCSSTF